MQSTDSIKIYAYGTSKDVVIEKEEVNCNNIAKRYKTGWLWLLCKKKYKIT